MITLILSKLKETLTLILNIFLTYRKSKAQRRKMNSQQSPTST